MEDLIPQIASDDNTLPDNSHLVLVTNLAVAAADNLGRPLYLARNYEEMFEAAGFVDLKMRYFRWPSNTWPDDEKDRDVGRLNCKNMGSDLEGLTRRLLARGLGLEASEITRYCAQAEEEIRDKNIHAYWLL